MLDSGELLSGRYRLEEVLGRGGMGEVWRATDLRLGRTVAIKALLPGRFGADDARFAAEARVMASLHHPAIVNIYDYGDSYLVMEFVDGKPLSSLLDERGRLDSVTTARLTAQVAEALEVVHQAGIVHRDVKPANILVDSGGNARLTDFGVAASGEGGDAVLGTARYMAPEQAMGQPVTPAADIYALGAVAYHCLAGHPPFGGEEAVQIALRHIQDEPPPLPPDAAPALRTAIERAMAKDPADRFPDAAALAAAIVSNPDSTLPMEPVAPAAPAASVATPRRRARVLVTVAAILALISLGGLLIAANLGDRPTSESPDQPLPAAPASQQPSPAPAGTQLPVRRSSPSPTPSRTPTAAITKPSAAPSTISPTPPRPPEPSSPPPTSSSP